MENNHSHKSAGFEENHNDQLSPSGKSYFLGIGINDYKNFNKLHNAVKDVQDIADLLYDKYHFSDHLPSNLVLNQNATRENILSALYQFCDPSAFKAEDRLLIYYSGHGYWDKTTKSGYWVPIEGIEKRPHTFIGNFEIQTYVGAMPFRHILIISDSCFSTSLLAQNTKGGQRAFLEWDNYPSRFIFASGKGTVDDGIPGQNSPFSGAILKMLRKNKSYLNISLLADQVTKHVQLAYQQKAAVAPLYNSGHDEGEFIFYPRLIDREEWLKAQKLNTITEYEKFIKQYPKSDYAKAAKTQVAKLKEQKEIKDWEIASKSHTIEALESFVKDYPKSKFIEKAQQQITFLKEMEEEKAWGRALREENINILEDFINKYPTSPHLPRARKQRNILLEKIDWKKACKENTIAVFNHFIKLYPDSKFNEEALVAIESIREKQEIKEWAYVEANSTIESLIRFIKKYPNGRYTSKANRLLNRKRDEKKLGSYNTIKELSEFSDNTQYEDLKQAANLKLGKLEDEREWKKALRSNTLTGYNNYLRRFSNGDYIAEAKKKKKILLDKDYIEEPNSPPKAPPGRPLLPNTPTKYSNQPISYYFKTWVLKIAADARRLRPYLVKIKTFLTQHDRKQYAIVLSILTGIILFLWFLIIIRDTVEEKAYKNAIHKGTIPALQDFKGEFEESIYIPRIDSLLQNLDIQQDTLLQKAEVLIEQNNHYEARIFLEQAKYNDPHNAKIQVKLYALNRKIAYRIDTLKTNAKILMDDEYDQIAKSYLEILLQLDSNDQEAQELYQKLMQ